MSEPNWYYYDRGKQGPFTQSQLLEKFRSDELSKDTLINRDGVQGWYPAYDFDVFFPGFQRRRRKKYLFNPQEAPAGRRLLAFLIDVVVIAAIVLATSFGFGYAYDALIAPTPDWAIWMASILGIMVAFLYFGAMESSRFQGTLGKMLMGLKVTNHSGGRVSFLKALARTCCKDPILGPSLSLFSKNKLGLHDLLTDSRVIRRTSRG